MAAKKSGGKGSKKAKGDTGSASGSGPEGKPANPAVSLEAKLARRKLDALKRGIHRIGEEEALPVSVHFVGIGKAGAGVLARILEDLPDDFLSDENASLTALALDIGDQDLGPVRAAAEKLPADKTQVETVAMEMPPRKDLFATLRRYREFLKLEYPRYYWNPNYEPWLPAKTALPAAGEHFDRATAKAVYGREYYDGERPLRDALQRFTKHVDASANQSVVCIIFGLGGGTGSGIVVDMARHLSNVNFGRRALVLGMGIAACDGDDQVHRGPDLFPVLNELDCMGDQAKNEGVIAVWGDLYRNPFTGGFITVPQNHVWEATKNLAATHDRVDREIASFATRNKGTDLWETLRLLNWVGAPPTQHAAARTPYGASWAHVLSFTEADGSGLPAKDLRRNLGLLDSYRPDFIEVRAGEAESAEIQGAAKALGDVFTPVADPEVTVVGGLESGSIQFILPCVAKVDFADFYTARAAYDGLDWEEKLSNHSWLLDLGVMLSEPAIRFDGMAGECLWGCACWVVVPYDQIRGPEQAAVKAAE